MKHLKTKLIFLLYFLFCHSTGFANAPLIGVIPKGNQHKFWQEVHKGVTAAQNKLPIKVVWRGPKADGNVKAQIAIIDYFIKQKAKAIVIAPNHHQKLIPSFKKATLAGIKIIVIDSNSEGNFHLAFVGTNNKEAGKIGARQLAKLLENKDAEITLVRHHKGQKSTDLREEGFLEELKNYPNLKLTHDPECGVTVGKAERCVIETLKNIQAPRGIFAPNESTTEGALRALMELKKAGSVKLVGFDENTFLKQGLEKDTVHGLIVQDPFQMGYLGVELAYKFLTGKKPVAQPPEVIYTPAKLLTKASKN